MQIVLLSSQFHSLTPFGNSKHFPPPFSSQIVPFGFSRNIFFTVENFVKYLECVRFSMDQCNFVPCWQATGLRHQHRPQKMQRKIAETRKVSKLKRKFQIFLCFCGLQTLWLVFMDAVSYWGCMRSVMIEWVWRTGGMTTIGLGKEVLGKKPVEMPLCTPENRKGSGLERTWGSTMRSRILNPSSNADIVRSHSECVSKLSLWLIVCY